ncbi:hypothetical protein PILCRDRAFT_658694 [Piloderma croceum F 1598]|uniref:Uncharacterized protein n=1 Tax=Piloderma croceum (strain F 1598) TaxID=765440 RepID=A0A0C3F7Q1_PILCF|nr:hypothetical protein PILCRDRAFT_658694 [Piloderma croceum F 1598]
MSFINIHEVNIVTFLSSQALADPHNHCVPIHETLRMPDDDDKTVLAISSLRSDVVLPIFACKQPEKLLICSGSCLRAGNLCTNTMMSCTGMHQSSALGPTLNCCHRDIRFYHWDTIAKDS